jgi:tol-pal system protein YbgF
VKKTAPAEREPGEIYQKAYSAYLAGQYAAAAAGFGAYLAKHPDAEFSSSAAYWLAETHAGKGDMPSALAAFDRMVESYPASVKAPAALLRGGEIAQKLGQKAEAGKRLRSIIGRYPDALEAKRAAAILKEIGQ